MPKQQIKQWMPDSHTIRSHRYIRLFGKLLHDPNLWHFNRRSVSGGFAVGLFVAFMPIPFQMIFAAAIAIGSRVNLVVSVALCWVTNPITIPPLFYMAYLLGDSLLGGRGGNFNFEMSWHWLQNSLGTVWQPFLLGCFIMAVTAAIFGNLAIRIMWRWQVTQDWINRRKLRRIKKKAETYLKNTQSEEPQNHC